MKKFLLTAVAVLCATSMWGGNLVSRPKGNSSKYKTMVANVSEATPRFNAPASRSEKSILFTLAGEPYTALTLGRPANTPMYAGFEFSAQNATAFAGNKITSVSICTGINSTTNKNNITSAKIYLTYDLEKDPFYTQDVTLGRDAYTFYDFKLDTPYEIEAGKAVYVLYTFNVKSANTDYPIPIDYLYHDGDEGGWVGYYDSTTKKIVWDNISYDYGYIPMKATITGENLPENGVQIFGIDAPEYTAPGETYTYLIGITGAAAGEATSVEVTTQMGNEPAVAHTYTFQAGLSYGEKGVFEVSDITCNTIGLDVPISIEVTKVNGVKNSQTAKASGTIMCFGRDLGFTHNVLIEEATGCWCGWCPRGIVLLEQIREKYTDGSVAIAAVHNGDQMAVTECQAFLEAYVSGFPSMIMNRAQEVDFTMDAFDEMYDYYHSMPAAAEITAVPKVADNDLTVTVSGTTRFALDSNVKGRFLISFYLTEDGMGPYDQTNYYANGQNGTLEGFSDKGSPVSVVYNDVARTIKDFPGIAGSVPAEIKGQQEYPYSYDISLAKVTSDKFNVIAMVTDATTGVVLNTTVVAAQKNAGVANAVADNDDAVISTANGVITVTGATDAVNVYTIDGRVVATSANGTLTAAVAPGLYIVKAGKTVAKVRI